VRRRKIAAALAAGAGVALFAANRTHRPGRLRPPVLTGKPLLIAHRGGARLAPENTIVAFRNGLETWGADMIEFDVRATADGHAVVIHDATVDRTTEGTGEVARMTLAELRELDAGYHFSPDDGASYPFRGRAVRVPTIEEVFETFPRARMTIEVKSGAVQEPLFAALERHGAAGQVVLGGMRDRDRTLFSRRHGGALSPSLEQLRPFVMLHRARLGAFWPIPGHVVQVPERYERSVIVTASFVAAVHRQGLDVHVWTVDERADIERLLDWGVDGLLTDRPDVLGTVLHERVGRPLAPGHAMT
jgi:glycerophosphoryl diester phosphodiesterase